VSAGYAPVGGDWRLSEGPACGTALRAFDFDMAISDTLDRTYVPDKGLRRLRRERNVFWHTGRGPVLAPPGSVIGRWEVAFVSGKPEERSDGSCLRWLRQILKFPVHPTARQLAGEQPGASFLR
jgi:hypothetical protein